MADFLSRIQTLIPGKQRGRLPQTELQKWGLRGIHLRPYQLEGVQWLTQCLGNQEGCILGDEMGLGKTCQTISLLLFISGACGKNGPFLVVSPLSVMENWRKEMESFAPSLKVLCYQGDKEKRAEIQLEAQTEEFHVLLTTYEMCLRDASFFKKWRWEALVVDEAHRLKNQNSLLYHSLTECERPLSTTSNSHTPNFTLAKTKELSKDSNCAAIIRKWNTYMTTDKLAQSGAPRKISPLGIKIITRTVSKNPRTTRGPSE